MCLCVCVYIYIYIYIYFLRSYDHLYLVETSLIDASQRPSSPSPFDAGSCLAGRLGER